MRSAKFPVPVRELRFDEVRRWRFDFAWPDLLVAAECEGGTWGRSRHTSGAGFEKDCEKYNAATLLGWRVYRFTAASIRSGEALTTLRHALERA